MVFLPLALQTKGLVAGWLEIRTLSGLPKHTISLLNSLSNRSIWEPWPPDSDLTGLAGLASRCRLAGNPDSGQSPEAYDVLLKFLSKSINLGALASRSRFSWPDGLASRCQAARWKSGFWASYCCTGEKRREEVLLSWRGNERGGVVHVFQCPVGSYSMIFFQAWLSGEKKSFCCLGGGMREGVLFMSSNVLLVPRFFFQAWLSFEFLMIWEGGWEWTGPYVAFEM